jgi:hypothetical protein
MPERLDRFYSCSVFNSLCVIGQCPVNMYITAPKIHTSKKIAVFLIIILLKFHYVMETMSLNKTAQVVSLKK